MFPLQLECGDQLPLLPAKVIGHLEMDGRFVASMTSLVLIKDFSWLCSATCPLSLSDFTCEDDDVSRTIGNDSNELGMMDTAVFA
jgi:hypothetical protein